MTETSKHTNGQLSVLGTTLVFLGSLYRVTTLQVAVKFPDTPPAVVKSPNISRFS